MREDPLTERTAGPVVPVEPVPRLEQRVGVASCHASSTRRSHGSSESGGTPVARACAEAAESPRSLARSGRSWCDTGCAPSSPLMLSHTGSSARRGDAVGRRRPWSPACPRSSGDRGVSPSNGRCDCAHRSRRTCGRGANQPPVVVGGEHARAWLRLSGTVPTRWWERSQESDRARRRDAWFEALGGPLAQPHGIDPGERGHPPIAQAIGASSKLAERGAVLARGPAAREGDVEAVPRVARQRAGRTLRRRVSPGSSGTWCRGLG